MKQGDGVWHVQHADEKNDIVWTALFLLTMKISSKHIYGIILSVMFAFMKS